MQKTQLSMPSVFYNDENKICVIDLPRLMDKLYAKNLTKEMSKKNSERIINFEYGRKTEK